MRQVSSGTPGGPGDPASELLERLALSELVMEHAADAVFLLNAEGRTVYANPAAERMFGWSKAELTGKKLHEVVHDRHPDGRPYPMEDCPLGQVFFSGESLYSHEDTFFHKDGRPVPVACSNAPVLRDGAVEGGVLIIRDISDARRAQQALAESEARFRNMADSAPVMMWVTDAGGHCTYLNRRWYEFTGQSPGQGQGLGWLDAVHPEDRGLAEEAFLAANAERRDYRVDFRLRRADGVYRWTIDAAAARFAGNGDYLGYVGSVMDIDERRETEARVALSEARYRALFESLDAGFCEVELKFEEDGRAVDYRFLEVNPAFERQTGLIDATGRWMRELAPEHEQHWFDIYGRVALTGESVRFEKEASALGYWYDVHAFRVGPPEARRVAILFNDISERRRSEVELRGLNDRLERQAAERTAERNRIWEMSHDLFAIMGFDGYLKAINPAWEATLGFDEATLLGLDFPKQVHPEDHSKIGATMERLKRGETVRGFEDRLRHADGSWRWISWTLVPQGDVFYAVGRDVTAEKEAAAELERAQEALRQSQKMEAMGQLTGGVAHDFNNLLTPIVGSLDMLQRRGLGGPREQRLIDGAMQSADRAKTLVQRLLAFARRQPLQPSAVDVGKLVAGMADLIASTSGPQIQVVVGAAEGLPPAKADPNQLEMALLNLGVNARDAMPDGGTLRITADLDRIGADHRSGLRPGPYVRLSVADTGVGMDEATLKRAVEPFFSTKGIGKGTGLGLSMVHGLASQLGGALNVESRPGIGTNIELWLPASDLPADEAGLAAPASAAPAKAGTALLVDDEELVRESTAGMLEDLGYEVVQAACAEEALRLIEDGLRPDVLVSDHLMPGITGTDLAGIVQAQLPATAVLIVSGYAEADGIAPHFPRLVKPFRNSDLAASLAELASSGPGLGQSAAQ
jgi:PAS domain S-box-containing protein